MTGNPVEILLVEDDPDDLELALHALQANHLSNSIHIARDGAEALAFLFGHENEDDDGAAAKNPKVILLDLKLPLVEGLEVLRRVKGDPRTRQLPVVVLTSSREERDVVESYQLGVNSYIVKPVDFEQFTQAVRQLGMYWVLLNEPPVM